MSQQVFKDPDKFQEYDRKSKPILAQHDGEPVLMGKAEDVYPGKLDHEAVGIARFPSKDALLTWHRSDAYRAFIPL